MRQNLSAGGAHDEITRWVGSNTDIEDQKAAAQALEEMNATLEGRVSERTSQLMQRKRRCGKARKWKPLDN